MQKVFVVATAALVLACGSDTPTSSSAPAPARNNSQPTVQFTVSPPGQAIVGVTPLTFTATGTDADGDALTFSWNFGDGRTASGSTTTTTFPKAGAFDVTVSASDGRGGTATAVRRVTARTLEGFWAGGISGLTSGLIIEHTGGGTFRGKAATSIQACGGRLDGFVNAPRAVTIDLIFTGSCSFGVAERYEATVDAELVTMNGTYCIGSDCFPLSFKRD